MRLPQSSRLPGTAACAISPWYGRGLAEHSLGRALYRKPRDQYVISKKIGRTLRRPRGPDAIKDQWLGGFEFQTVFNYAYDGVMRSFEDSLQRFGINRVDVLLVHDLDPWDHNPATLNAYFTQLKTSGWRALAELREARVIGGIGAGFNSKGSIPRFLDLFDIEFFLLAMRYTLLEQEVLPAAPAAPLSRVLMRARAIDARREPTQARRGRRRRLELRSDRRQPVHRARIPRRRRRSGELAGMTANQGAILTTLIRWYGPAEILRMATSVNAELLAMSGPRSPYPGKLGVVEEGALADLVLVDGDPLANLNLIAVPERNFLVIMKDGRFVKNAL
jgi:aryl-alcohol dehydrogenase-like predicted oxidoreductase